MKGPTPTTVVGALALLPSQIEANGRAFKLEIFCDYHPEDIRVCYALDDSDNKNIASHGSWRNPYAGGAIQSFLVLRERIATDAELVLALISVHNWLIKNNLIAPNFDFR